MDITLAVADQLALIVPGATIYRENQEQKFDEPSFYVYEIHANSKDQLMNSQMRSHLYCVMYFPNPDDEDVGLKEQCEIMRSKLLDEFERLDSLAIKVSNKEAKIEEDTLNFTFKLRYRVRQQVDLPVLNTLEQEGILKNG